MTLDAEKISTKNSVVALALALTFGSFGAHRFYVGKWKSGLVYLIFGSVLPSIKITQKILNILGSDFTLKTAWYISICSILVFVAILYDIFAMYSQSFTDNKGNVIISGSEKDEIVGRSMEEKFTDNLTAFSAVLALATCLILYFFVL